MLPAGEPLEPCTYPDTRWRAETTDLECEIENWAGRLESLEARWRGAQASDEITVLYADSMSLFREMISRLKALSDGLKTMRRRMP